MAFSSGLVTFRRFFVAGKPFDEVDDRFVNALREYRFGAAGSADPTTQMGWTNPTHLFDHDIAPEKIAFGRYVHFWLRVDKLNAPSSVARSYQRLEEETALKASGRAFLTKTEQRLAREAAKLRVEQEVKSGAFRRMSTIPVLMDLESNTLLLASTSSAASDQLLEIFGNTFRRALEPADADRLAERLLGSNARALEQVRPFHLVRPPEGTDDADAMPGVDVAFLGKEFITWLWRLIDSDEPNTLKLRSGDAISVIIDRSLRLECDFRMTGSTVVTADAPAGLPESRAALAIGKQPTKAGLIVGSAVGEFAFSLDGRKMTVSSLVLPDDQEERDVRASIEQRFERCFDLTTILDVMFETFLRARISDHWGEAERDLKRWAKGVDEKRQRTIALASS